MQKLGKTSSFLYAEGTLQSYYVMAHVTPVCPALAKSCPLINFKLISHKYTFHCIMDGLYS